MEQHVLYDRKELDGALTAQKRTRTAMALVAAVGLTLCVVLCCLATRHNQSVTLPLTIGTSILSGWIVIFLSHSRYEGARAQARHVELMLTGPRERFSGQFEKQGDVYRVKRGVPIRKVRFREEFHETLLTVAEEKARFLPDAFTGTVETVYDCIVAYEAEEESR